MRILIVEDDQRIVGFMKRGLEAEEHAVDIASGLSQAVHLINAHTFDIIIIDIFLGLDDGLEICRTLRQQHVASPILIITAKGTIETKNASKEAGADAYLPKPFAFEDLVATIGHLCARSTPSDSQQVVPAQPTRTPEISANAFTKSDPPRPTNMTIPETDIGA